MIKKLLLLLLLLFTLAPIMGGNHDDATFDEIEKAAAAVTRIQLHGLYGGHNQRSFNPARYAEMVDNSGFDGAVFHDDSPWDADACPETGPKSTGPYQFPIEKMAGGRKFNLNKRNEWWWKKTEQIVEEFAKRGLWQVHKFFTDYGRTHWRQYSGYNCKLHWTVENNRGFNWGDKSEPLFENWIKALGSGPNAFSWATWKFLKGDILEGFNFDVTKGGPAIELYVEGMFDIFERVRAKYPKKFRLIVSYYNEGFSNWDAQGPNATFLGDLDIDDRNLQVFRIIAAKHGFEQHPRFREAVDFKHRVRSTNEPQWHQTSKGWRLYLAPRSLYHEAHGIRFGNNPADPGASVQSFTSAGLPLNRVIWSSDGSGKEDAAYYTDMGKLRKWLDGTGKSYILDVKQPVDDSIQKWDRFNTMKNLELYFPKLKKAVFEQSSILWFPKFKNQEVPCSIKTQEGGWQAVA